MMQSLRARLVLGLLLGTAALVGAACAALFALQRRELYRVFDERLTTSAHALALVIHPSRFGDWYDAQAVDRLPAERFHQGAVFQLWSDRPIQVPQTARRGDPMEFDGKMLDDDPDARDDERRPPPPPAAADRRREFDEGPDDPPFRGRPRPEDLRFRGPRVFVIRSPSLGTANLPKLVPTGSGIHAQTVTMPDGHRGRAIGAVVQLPGPPPGPGPRPPPRAQLTAVVAAPTADIETQLRYLGTLLVATALATLVLSGGMAWLVVTRGLRPLRSVARQISTLDETDLKQRLSPRGVPREIEPVVSQLNALLTRLDEAFERERTLAANVAHELRTPVAEIRAIAEVTLSRLRDPEEYRGALGETLDVVRSLQGVIERLLILARLESGQMQPEWRTIPLRPLLEDQWDSAMTATERRKICFENRCQPDAVIRGDPTLTVVVLSNVMINAATYTPSGGCVTTDVRRNGAECLVSIANTGCSMSESDVERAFDRFWRADTARTATGLHCGLGLTLVRRAMQAMNGTATARLDGNGRFVIDLTFDTPGEVNSP